MYWFGKDGRVAIEVARIGLAVAVLMAWNRAAVSSYATLLDTFAHGSYHPLGIMRLLGGDAPPAAFLEACKLVALVATLSLLVGLFSRVSAVLSLLAMLFVCGIREAYSGGWAHSYVPLLSAQLVFAFAPSGRMLSVDALLRRRWRGTGELPAHIPAWPVLLLQLAAAFTFFNAAVWKIRTGGGLDWVFSDSLRHHILTAFDWVDNERTALADLIVRDATLWKVVAMANILSQVAPMVACFFVHRPRVRLLFGSFFVIETIALDLVMNLPNYHWLPLAVVFVDWDRLLGWVNRRRPLPAAMQPAAEPSTPPPPHPLANLVIAVFLLQFVVYTVGPRGVDATLNAYPLSQYRMFATIRAKKPYSVHQTWEFDTLRFAVEGSRMKVWPEAAATLDERFRKFHRARSAAQVQSILRQARRRVNRVRPTSIQLSLYILQAPAHPAPAHLVPHPIGVLGQLRGKEFRTMLGKAAADTSGSYIEPKPLGVEAAGEFPVSYMLDRDPRLRPLEVVRREGNRIYYRPREGGRYTFVGQIGQERFILAEARHLAASGGELSEESESSPEQP